MQLLPELADIMQAHDLDDVKITVDGAGYVRVFTITEATIYPLTTAGYDVWIYEGSELLAKVGTVQTP